MSISKCPECSSEPNTEHEFMTSSIKTAWLCGSWMHIGYGFMQSTKCAYNVGYQAAKDDVKSDNRLGSDFETEDEELGRAWEDGYEAALDELGVD